MKKILMILIWVFSLGVFAQQTPNWYDDNQRAFNYPVSQYFVGFAEGEKRSYESIEAAMSRMKNEARKEAVSTIRVHVQSTTNINGLSRTLETMETTLYESLEEFSSKIKISVDIEIPGLQVESWRNPQTGEIAAFAYVKKSTLTRQLEKKITVCLTKIETAMDQIDQLISTGQKLQARSVAEKTVPKFVEVDESQKILVAVDENADEQTLQLPETRSLQSRLTSMIAQLKHGLNIYLSCSANMFGKNYGTLKSEIQGELSKMGCNFVTNAAQSDWAIYVTAPAREYNQSTYGSVTSYFVYVDATIVVDKTATGQRIFEDQISEKGGHTHNYEQAARDAYKQISPKISRIIKEQIQE